MQWIFAIVCACLLGWVGGWGGVLSGFIVGWVIGALAARSSEPTPGHNAPTRHAAETPRPPGLPLAAQRPPEPPVLVQKPLGRVSNEQSPPARTPFEIRVVLGTSTPPVSAPTPSNRSKPKLTWHTSGQPLNVGDVQIGGGMVYMADRALAWPGEPSAIIPSFKVDRVAADPSEDFGFYPGYDRITPTQRRSYLEWLAAGRVDADPAQRSLGHLFVFFYGLERRIVLDGDRNPTLLEELVRLLQHYGPAHRSRSLKSYFLQLLHFGGWQLGGETYRALWPRLLDFDGERADAEGLRFVLASLYQGREPMDWSVGYRVALANEESRRSTVVSRAREQFWALFAQRFGERYPDGMVLQAAARPTLVSYRAASGALLQMRWNQQNPGGLRVDLPDVMGLARQFEELPRLWNSCVDALTGYSRAIGSKKTGDAATLAAWHALPVELRRAEEHPVREAFDELLTTLPREGEYIFVPSGTLAVLAGLGERAKLTAAQSQHITALVSGLGWCIAPDPILTGLPLAWTQELVLHSTGMHDTSAPHLRGLIRCLYLAVAVAAAHGEIESDEMESFHKTIASQIQREADWQLIRATEAALRRDPNIALRAMPQIAKIIPAESRSAVLGMMVRVAAADGEVSLDELKTLRRMARAFGLDADAVENVLHGDDAFREVVVEGGGGKRTLGETIPPPGVASPAFALDRERIAALTLETREVISLLSVVMADPDEPTAPVETPVAASCSPPTSMEWLGELDSRFHLALLSLIERDEWMLAEFDGLAQRYHLLPDDLFDSINTWSDEALGDFLLVKMDTVRVFRLLLPAAGQSSSSLAA